MAIVGIGAVSQQDDATIIRSGYISQGEQLMIGRKGAVGDILGYFFDAKGDVVTDIKIHNELIGLPLSALKTIPVRVGVAGEKISRSHCLCNERRLYQRTGYRSGHSSGDFT